MNAACALESVELFASKLAHPESLAFDARGDLWVGCESGQLYRVSSGGVAIPSAHIGGPCAGLAFSPQDVLFALRPSGKVFKIASNGEAELFGARFPQGLRQGVFGANGDFFATVTGLWGKRTGAVWRLRAGAAEPETVSPPMGFLGGIALGADGAALYVAESDSNTIYRLELGADARVGAPQAFARECGRVPVGLAADAEGSVYAACYASDEIWKAHPDGGLSLIAADPWSWRLSGPSALAFGGPDNAGLYVCNSGKAHVSRLRPGSKGPAPVGLSAAKKLRLRPSPL